MWASAGGVRDTGSIPGSGRSPGEGHGNPLQYSCLETPMDRGVWQATVHRVTKSQTRLKQHSMHACPWDRWYMNQWPLVEEELEEWWEPKGSVIVYHIVINWTDLWQNNSTFCAHSVIKECNRYVFSPSKLIKMYFITRPEIWVVWIIFANKYPKFYCLLLSG